MRRILSIAICSFWLAAQCSAGLLYFMNSNNQTVTGTVTLGRVGGGSTGGNVLGTGFSAIGSFWQVTWTGGGTNGLRSTGSSSVALFSMATNSWWVLYVNGSNYNQLREFTGNPNSGGVPIVLATNSFSWFFPSEWAGTEVQIKATNGQTLGTWGLPALIGSEGYTLSASIVTNANLLTNAQVYFDGQLLSSIALASATNNPAGLGGYRPGYNIEFDGTYQDGDWKIQRSDGSVALSGSVSTLNDAINGRFTLTGTNTATFWTRVPGGDGMGGAWVPTPVTFGQNNNVTTYMFTGATNPTTVPVPSPTPTPIPQPSPLTTPATNTTTITTNNLASDEIVDVTVPEANVPSYDVGQTNLVQEAQTVFGRVADGYENFADAFNYTSLTFNEFKKLYLPPPGTECTLSFGPISINLAQFIPGWVRGASKLVFLFAALAAIKRMLWEAFA